MRKLVLLVSALNKKGIAGRNQATGKGVQFGLREIFNDEKITTMIGIKEAPGLEGKTVIVQGLGKVGYHMAKHLQERRWLSHYLCYRKKWGNI